tara:strand:- start:151 stop:384 length:234 start_codon:yes stop_codon:yes gene_type:complete
MLRKELGVDQPCARPPRARFVSGPNPAIKRTGAYADSAAKIVNAFAPPAQGIEETLVTLLRLDVIVGQPDSTHFSAS